MTERVSTVLFDLDDTLCTYRRSGAEVLDAAFTDVGVDPVFTADDYHRNYGDFVADSDSIEDLRESCFAYLAEQKGRDPDLGRAVARAFAAERDHTNVDPLPGAVETVAHLAEDHRLGLVTNGAAGMQAQKLGAIGLADAFESTVFAGYDTPAKPDPEPFHRALDALGESPAAAVHVGNSLTSDVPGAQAAGVKAAWLSDGTSDPVPEPDYTVASLDELTRYPWR